MSAHVAEVEVARELLTPVSVGTFRANTVPSVDLYLEKRLSSRRKERRYALYRRGDQSVTGDHLRTLADSGVTTLFIRTDQQDAYRAYLERHLEEFLADESTSPEAKAEVVYETATGLVQDVLREPTSPESLKRTKRLVTGTIDFVLDEDDALRSFVSAMAKDYSTYTHSINVCVYAISLAKRRGMAKAMLHEVALGALLHDVGKISIPQEVLHRKGPLTDDEFELVKKHPEIGVDMLKKGASLSDGVYEIVLGHHEKTDGSGYPRGLKGPDIHPWAKMACIIDVFDALTTNRSYKKAMTFFDALKLMRDEMHTQFERDLWKDFIVMLGHEL